METLRTSNIAHKITATITTKMITKEIIILMVKVVSSAVKY
jgi:hypothetical protein